MPRADQRVVRNFGLLSGSHKKKGCRRSHACGSLSRLPAGLASSAAWRSWPACPYGPAADFRSSALRLRLSTYLPLSQCLFGCQIVLGASCASIVVIPQEGLNSEVELSRAV